jgi:hypothetical protein
VEGHAAAAGLPRQGDAVRRDRADHRLQPVRHETGVVGASYPRGEAEEEAASFLAGREYLPSAQAGEVLATHRRASG